MIVERCPTPRWISFVMFYVLSMVYCIDKYKKEDDLKAKNREKWPWSDLNFIGSYKKVTWVIFFAKVPLLEYVNLIIETALVLVSLQIGNEIINFVNLQIRKYVN